MDYLLVCEIVHTPGHVSIDGLTHVAVPFDGTLATGRRVLRDAHAAAQRENARLRFSCVRHRLVMNDETAWSHARVAVMPDARAGAF